LLRTCIAFWKKREPNTVFRILHSAAKHHSELRLTSKEEEAYRKAYQYLNYDLFNTAITRSVIACTMASWSIGDAVPLGEAVAAGESPERNVGGWNTCG